VKLSGANLIAINEAEISGADLSKAIITEHEMILCQANHSD
jgi:uncharacterized protein YjbI with pentapeptide repeats